MNPYGQSSYPGNYQQPAAFNSLVLFIGGVPLYCDENYLIQYLLNFDQVMWLQLGRDLMTGMSKGHAHAMMATEAGHYRVLSQKYHMIGGIKVGVSTWKSPSEYLSNKDEQLKRKIFIKKLHPYTNDHELVQYFGIFGPIEKAEIRRNHHDGSSRKIGFVLFEDIASAERALKVKTHILRSRELIVTKCLSVKETKSLKKTEYDQDHDAEEERDEMIDQNSFLSLQRRMNQSLVKDDQSQAVHEGNNFQPLSSSFHYQSQHTAKEKDSDHSMSQSKLHPLNPQNSMQRQSLTFTMEHNTTKERVEDEPFSLSEAFPRESTEPFQQQSNQDLSITNQELSYLSRGLMDDTQELPAPATHYEVKFFTFPGYW